MKRMENTSSTFPNCYYCTLEIKLNDAVFSKQGNGSNNRHYYHKACAEEAKLL